jgi:hypothetical protein
MTVSSTINDVYIQLKIFVQKCLAENIFTETCCQRIISVQKYVCRNVLLTYFLEINY